MRGATRYKMDRNTLIFPVEGRPGWTVSLTYIEGEKSPRIEGKDEKNNPLSQEILDKMRLTLKPGDNE
jgi:hypothetical protein